MESNKEHAWYRKESDAVAAELGTTRSGGLTDREAAERLALHGPNEIREKGGKSPLLILFEQFTSTMVLILVAAAVISGFLGKYTETVAIAAIVVLFALLGFFQEYRAERAMAALKKMTVPLVRVLRNGLVVERSAETLVPGDIVLLEAGNIVPADIRLLEAVNLRTLEAALTGESEPVEKTSEALDGRDLPLGDRRNMAYTGTVVAYGRGTGVAVLTGMETELGKIAALIQESKDQPTPLQRQLDTVGKALALFGFLVAGLVLGIGMLQGEGLGEMLLTAVSVAVAVVPEGLPAVVTITLALGGQRMLKRKALIRKLPAVETLGSVTEICSDKTGTLTVNRMTVTIIDVVGHYVELAGTGGHPAPALAPAPADRDAANRYPPAVRLMLAGCALCNDASLSPDVESGRMAAIGDPTEGALLVAASEAGLLKDDLESVFPRVAELPFDSKRKRMTTVHAAGQIPKRFTPALEPFATFETPFFAVTKGAVDGLLDICDRIWVETGVRPFDRELRDRMRTANDQMAQNGMRVLGMALLPLERPHGENGLETLEQNMILVGLTGMVDPPRPEVREAVRVCKKAGIRPIMITGDHPLTARFIAYDLGISESGRVRTGQEIDGMSYAELEREVDTISVYARVSPEHKLRIVEALQNKGRVVAMTGDGVNDAPALKRSDIGIAMGITGTDVSKEASDVVLLDDNFATIVAAVEEGRTIYANIQRFVQFSIAGNIGKIIVMLLAPFFGITLALLPLQLLWLNLLTDGLLGLGLGVEATEPGIMNKPPRSPSAGFFGDGLKTHIVWIGVLIGFVALGVGLFYYQEAPEESRVWRTMIFTTIAFLQIGQALASRSTEAALFSRKTNPNRFMSLMVLLVLGLQLSVLYVPSLVDVFDTVPLSPIDLAVCACLGSISLVAIELEKWIFRRRRSNPRSTAEPHPHGPEY